MPPRRASSLSRLSEIPADQSVDVTSLHLPVQSVGGAGYVCTSSTRRTTISSTRGAAAAAAETPSGAETLSLPGLPGATVICNPATSPVEEEVVRTTTDPYGPVK